MSCLLLKTIFMVLCYMILAPRIYAESAINPVDITPLPFSPSAAPSINIDNAGFNPEPVNQVYLRQEYSYNNDWSGVSSKPRDVFDHREYFEEQETRQGFIYNYNDHRLKSQIGNEDADMNDRIILREKWKGLLGFDLFYLYFQAKKVENWAKEKLSVKIFDMKGRPQFKKNKILYVFKKTF